MRRRIAAGLVIMMIISIVVSFPDTIRADTDCCWGYFNFSDGNSTWVPVDFGDAFCYGTDPEELEQNATICFPLIFYGGDWYSATSQELVGNPEDLFWVEEEIQAGEELLTCNGWKTWEDTGQWYLEYEITGTAADIAAISMKIRLRQNNGDEVRAGYEKNFSGKVNPWWTKSDSCLGDFIFSDYTGKCAVDFADAFYYGKEKEKLSAGDTICFPLIFYGGTSWYPATKQELQGIPEELFKVREVITQGKDILVSNGWKTWEDSGQWYLEYVVADKLKDVTDIDMTVRLEQEREQRVCFGYEKKFTGKAVPWWNKVSDCIAEFEFEDYEGPCVVDLKKPYTSAQSDCLQEGDVICYPLMFYSGDGNWYGASTKEMKKNPGDILSVTEELQSGEDVIAFNGWKTWENGCWYAEYKVVNVKQESFIDMNVQLCQENGKRKGEKVHYVSTVKPWWELTGGNAYNAKPWWEQTDGCIANFHFTDYDGPCMTGLGDPYTSTGTAKLGEKDVICFPLQFYAGDGNWYGATDFEMEGTPDDLFSLETEIKAGGKLLKFNGWKTWENGCWYAEYIAENVKKQTDLNMQVRLVQPEERHSEWIPFEGTAVPWWCETDQCIGNFVFEDYEGPCIVDLKQPYTSSGTDKVGSGGVVCFPLEFLAGDGNWYGATQKELQDDPSETYEVKNLIQSGDGLLEFTGWKTWENGCWYAEYTVGNTPVDREIACSILLSQKKSGRRGQAVNWKGTAQKGYLLANFKLATYEGPCIVDLGAPETCNYTDTVLKGAIISFPLYFYGGDEEYYPALESEMQDDPSSLFEVNSELSDDHGISCMGWKLSENGQWCLQYKIGDDIEPGNVKICVWLTQDNGKLTGDKRTFEGKVDVKNQTGDYIIETMKEKKEKFPEWKLKTAAAALAAAMVAGIAVIKSICVKEKRKGKKQ